jgi:hypothetical protein
MSARRSRAASSAARRTSSPATRSSCRFPAPSSPALPDLGAQDLRPRLRRHDRLGARAGPGRRAQRHPAPCRTGPRPAVGTDAIALLGLDDVAVDVNVTPDRGYALSIRGIAREYAHATGAAFRDPAEHEWDEVQPGSGFSLAVDDRKPIRGRVGASEFVARVVRDVDPSRPTPPWMVARLTLAGIRSLGILIDITNYVMLELGNPIHGYDLDRLQGGITVRRASGELTTLDGKERTLSPRTSSSPTSPVRSASPASWAAARRR